MKLVVGDEFSESRCGNEGSGFTAFSEYRARIGGLDPGTYSLEVVHDLSTGEPDTLVARATVTVR